MQLTFDLIQIKEYLITSQRTLESESTPNTLHNQPTHCLILSSLFNLFSYHYGERHPMKPARLTLTNSLVMGYGLHKYMDVYTPRPATRDELEMFHDSEYVDFLSR